MRCKTASQKASQLAYAWERFQTPLQRASTQWSAPEHEQQSSRVHDLIPWRDQACAESADQRHAPCCLHARSNGSFVLPPAHLGSFRTISECTLDV